MEINMIFKEMIEEIIRRYTYEGEANYEEIVEGITKAVKELIRETDTADPWKLKEALLKKLEE